MQAKLARAIPMPAQTILGARQKAWFLGRLRTLKNDPGKFGGSTTGTLDVRTGPQTYQVLFASLKDKLHV
jgi:hypothetical protein